MPENQLKFNNNFYSDIPSDIKDSFTFNFNSYELFLKNLSFNQHSFFEEWLDLKRESICEKLFRKDIDLDWKWGLCFPFFSLLERYVSSFSKPIIIGLSGLPGSGKSTLGEWINNLASSLNLEIKVISLDDFYLPGLEMDIAMKGNPWNVPRGIPGSHSIELLKNTLDSYNRSGKIKCPTFDKSLRDGLGDRSGWIESRPKVLILEGWFVGCEPLQSRSKLNNIYKPTLTQFESEYREVVQNRLREYSDIWQMLCKTWHLKATNIENTINWKKQQENEMLMKKGSALRGHKLTNFIRMILTCIPQESLSHINSDTIVSIDQYRRVCNLVSNSYS